MPCSMLNGHPPRITTLRSHLGIWFQHPTPTGKRIVQFSTMPRRWRRERIATRFSTGGGAASKELTAPSCPLDFYAFPHIFEEILSYILEAKDARTLHKLRLVCSDVRDIVDDRLFGHLVVRRDQVYDSIGGIFRDWSRARPRVLDIHHHAVRRRGRHRKRQVCGDGPQRHFLEDPDHRIQLVRNFIPQTCDDPKDDEVHTCSRPRVPASATVIHFHSAVSEERTEICRSLCVNPSPGAKRNVFRIGYNPALGLLARLYFHPFDLCTEDKNSETEIVIMFVPVGQGHLLRSGSNGPTGGGFMKPWDCFWSPVGGAFRSAAPFLHRLLRVKILFVGPESWDETWYGNDDLFTRYVESRKLSGEPLWMLAWKYALRQRPPLHYEHFTARVSFVSWQDFRAREPKLYNLCVKE